jgi:hypothetical protein
MHQQLWGYKVEDKLILGVREQKKLNTTALVYGYALFVRLGGHLWPADPLELIRGNQGSPQTK